MTKYEAKFGGVAQLGEHLPCKQGVRSSILLISTSISSTQASRKCDICVVVARRSTFVSLNNKLKIILENKSVGERHENTYLAVANPLMFLRKENVSEENE